MSAATKEQNLFWVYLGALAIVHADRDLAGALAGEARGDQRCATAAVAATLGVPTTRVRHRRCSSSARRSARSPVRSTCTGVGSRSRWSSASSSGSGIFVMLIVGGIDSLWGPVLGAAFYVWLPHLLTRLDIEVFGHAIRDYNQIVYGAGAAVDDDLHARGPRRLLPADQGTAPARARARRPANVAERLLRAHAVRRWSRSRSSPTSRCRPSHARRARERAAVGRDGGGPGDAQGDRHRRRLRRRARGRRREPRRA